MADTEEKQATGGQGARLLYSAVQRFSTDDGPGIRSTVFVMGCSLRCAWCHNPENLEMHPVLRYDDAVCIRCGRCVATCVRQVHAIGADGTHMVDRSRCQARGACAQACLTGAVSLTGTWATPEELFAIAVRDRDFYRESGGGVTISGGEPLLQAEGVALLLERCQLAGIHTAIETAGFVPWGAFEVVLPYTRLFLYDVKIASTDKHRRWTGKGNELILDNLRRLDEACAATGAGLVIRTPVIPGVVDEAELAAIAELIADLPHTRPHELLPYHTYGKAKYALWGREQRVDMDDPD